MEEALKDVAALATIPVPTTNVREVLTQIYRRGQEVAKGITPEFYELFPMTSVQRNLALPLAINYSILFQTLRQSINRLWYEVLGVLYMEPVDTSAPLFQTFLDHLNTLYPANPANEENAARASKAAAKIEQMRELEAVQDRVERLLTVYASLCVESEGEELSDFSEEQIEALAEQLKSYPVDNPDPSPPSFHEVARAIGIPEDQIPPDFDRGSLEKFYVSLLSIDAVGAPPIVEALDILDFTVFQTARDLFLSASVFVLNWRGVYPLSNVATAAVLFNWLVYDVRNVGVAAIHAINIGRHQGDQFTLEQKLGDQTVTVPLPGPQYQSQSRSRNLERERSKLDDDIKSLRSAALTSSTGDLWMSNMFRFGADVSSEEQDINQQERDSEIDRLLQSVMRTKAVYDQMQHAAIEERHSHQSVSNRESNPETISRVINDLSDSIKKSWLPEWLWRGFHRLFYTYEIDTRASGRRIYGPAETIVIQEITAMGSLAGETTIRLSSWINAGHRILNDVDHAALDIVGTVLTYDNYMVKAVQAVSGGVAAYTALQLRGTIFRALDYHNVAAPLVHGTLITATFAAGAVVADYISGQIYNPTTYISHAYLSKVWGTILIAYTTKAAFGLRPITLRFRGGELFQRFGVPADKAFKVKNLVFPYIVFSDELRNKTPAQIQAYLEKLNKPIVFWAGVVAMICIMEASWDPVLTNYSRNTAYDYLLSNTGEFLQPWRHGEYAKFLKDSWVMPSIHLVKEVQRAALYSLIMTGTQYPTVSEASFNALRVLSISGEIPGSSLAKGPNTNADQIQAIATQLLFVYLRDWYQEGNDIGLKSPSNIRRLREGAKLSLHGEDDKALTPLRTIFQHLEDYAKTESFVDFQVERDTLEALSNGQVVHLILSLGKALQLAIELDADLRAQTIVTATIQRAISLTRSTVNLLNGLVDRTNLAIILTTAGRRRVWASFGPSDAEVNSSSTEISGWVLHMQNVYDVQEAENALKPGEDADLHRKRNNTIEETAEKALGLSGLEGKGFLLSSNEPYYRRLRLAIEDPLVGAAILPEALDTSTDTTLASIFRPIYKKLTIQSFGLRPDGVPAVYLRDISVRTSETSPKPVGFSVLIEKPWARRLLEEAQRTLPVKMQYALQPSTMEVDRKALSYRQTNTFQQILNFGLMGFWLRLLYNLLVINQDIVVEQDKNSKQPIEFALLREIVLPLQTAIYNADTRQGAREVYALFTVYEWDAERVMREIV